MGAVELGYSILNSFITPNWIKLLLVSSVIYMAYVSVCALRTLWGKFFVREKHLINIYGHGSFAVITGGAEGIGRSFAFSLAKRGFNLIILDKQSDLLTETSHAIMMRYPNVEVRKIVTDFTNCQKDGYFDELYNQFSGLDISILVNNVGLFFYGNLVDIEEKNIMDLVNVNVMPAVMLTRKLLPKLNARGRRSAVITISSNESFDVYPGMTTIYGASKAFLNHFMLSLQEEMKEKIDFLTVTPALVSTRLTYFPPLDMHTISPDQCSESSLKNLGNTKMTYGHWKHELFAPLVNKWSFGRDLAQKELLRKFRQGKERMKKAT
jgi:17beta-estradiol 17-dehydrogenase / very-long-chain 3-oxoacyl-CoA reductase